MFGGNKRAPVFTDQVETIVGQASQFKGTLSAGGTIRVDGQVEGEIASKGDVIVGEAGVIRAQVKGRSAMIAGTVHGNVDVFDKLELTSTARLFGDIKTGVLIIGEGAVFKGSCEMRQSNDKAETTTPPHDTKGGSAKS